MKKPQHLPGPKNEKPDSMVGLSKNQQISSEFIPLFNVMFPSLPIVLLVLVFFIFVIIKRRLIRRIVLIFAVAFYREETIIFPLRLMLMRRLVINKIGHYRTSNKLTGRSLYREEVMLCQ